MRETVQDKINSWFVENRHPETGEYPDFPETDEGGCGPCVFAVGLMLLRTLVWCAWVPCCVRAGVGCTAPVAYVFGRAFRVLPGVRAAAVCRVMCRLPGKAGSAVCGENCGWLGLLARLQRVDLWVCRVFAEVLHCAPSWRAPLDSGGQARGPIPGARNAVPTEVALAWLQRLHVDALGCCCAGPRSSSTLPRLRRSPTRQWRPRKAGRRRRATRARGGRARGRGARPTARRMRRPPWRRCGPA